MRAEGWLGEEMYPEVAIEQPKRTQVFRLWLDAVGISYDLHRYLDGIPPYP